MKMIGIIAEFTVKSDKVEEFLNAAKPLVKGSNEEAGCLKYELHKDLKSDNVFFMVEEWKDQAAIDSHNQSAHYTSIVPKLAAFMAQEAKVTLIEKVL